MQQVNAIESQFFKKYQAAISFVVIALVTLLMLMPQFGEAVGCLVSGFGTLVIGLTSFKKSDKVSGWSFSSIGLALLIIGIALQLELYPA